VRVIGEDGEQIGVMMLGRALDLARERDLDLVEIQPQAVPPVCKIMDYGRFKYETSKRESDARKRQKQSEIKEIRLHVHTDSHDVTIRVKKIIQFLAEGDKVKVSVQFRGREAIHPELGRQLLESILSQLEGIALSERRPEMEGRNMWMMLVRAPGWDPKKNPDPKPVSVVAPQTAAVVAQAAPVSITPTPDPAPDEPAKAPDAPSSPTA
jgi:translation initiation factor IF-3